MDDEDGGGAGRHDEGQVRMTRESLTEAGSSSSSSQPPQTEDNVLAPSAPDRFANEAAAAAAAAKAATSPNKSTNASTIATTNTNARRARFLLPSSNGAFGSSSASSNVGSSSETDSSAAARAGGKGAGAGATSTMSLKDGGSGSSSSSGGGTTAAAAVTATGTSSSGGGVTTTTGGSSSSGRSTSGSGSGNGSSGDLGGSSSGHGRGGPSSGSGSSGEDRSTSARSRSSGDDIDLSAVSGGKKVNIGISSSVLVQGSAVDNDASSGRGIVNTSSTRARQQQQGPGGVAIAAGLHHHGHRHHGGHKHHIQHQHSHQHQPKHQPKHQPHASSSSLLKAPRPSPTATSTSAASPELGTFVQPDRMTPSGHAAVVASAKLSSPPVSPRRGATARRKDHHSPGGGGSSSISSSGSIPTTKTTMTTAHAFSLPKTMPPPEELLSGGEDSSSVRPMSVSAEGLPLPPTEINKVSSSSHHHHHRSHAKKRQLLQPPLSSAETTSTSSASSVVDAKVKVKAKAPSSNSRGIAAADGRKSASSSPSPPLLPTAMKGSSAVVTTKTSKKKLRRSSETFDDSSSSSSSSSSKNSSSNSGSEGGYEGSSSSNAETREGGSCSSPSVSSSEASGGADSKRGGHGTKRMKSSLLTGLYPIGGGAGHSSQVVPPPLCSAQARDMRRTGSSSASSSDLADLSAAASLPSVSGVTGKDFTFRARDSSRDSKSSSLSLSSSSMDPPPPAEPETRTERASVGGKVSAAALKMDESFKRKIERACSAQNDRRRRQLQLLSLDRHGMKSDLRRKRSIRDMEGEPEDSSSLSDEPGDRKRKRTPTKLVSIPPVMGPCAMDWEAAVAPVPDLSSIWQKSPIYCIGTDAMAAVMAFLEPPEVHTVLSMPLSKTWRSVFTAPQELWKILCLEGPFYAKIDDDQPDSDSENSSVCSFPVCSNAESRHIFGRYRLLYTSFVRCMRYLARIKDDAVNGRAPSALDDVAGLAPNLPFNGNASLKDFFHKARGIIHDKRRRGSASDSSSSESSALSSGDENHGIPDPTPTAAPSSPIGVCDDGSSVESAARATAAARKKQGKNKKVRYGNSKLTQRLLGPSIENGVGGPVELPWSCAIYSVVNWMVAFADVEGIQVMCLKVLPCLLEDEKQRTTAQRAGLTDIVLRAMVLFPDSVEVHTAAFHTLVLLARPLGGHEGDLFHSAMLNASGIFNVGTNTGRNGIAIMLDSMRRFSREEVLQAMSCWSMVNIALIPKQKTMLVKLGGISVVANAMMQHPFNAEVQFRALFALINLVIPSENLAEEDPADVAAQRELGVSGDVTERGMLDENVGQISNLVVVAMKNFCSSEAILNRACLVLHNLSLNEEYHRSLLWTPNCYQMLEWCIGNYRHDQVLQQSAGGTLQRLQMTLANDSDLRMRFLETIRAQQQSQLEQVRREAMSIQEVQN